jgi:hypothetical protein
MVSIKIFLVTIFTGILITSGANAVEVSSNELIDKAKDYDQKEVIFTGEVIGDVMKRGQYGWINVSDDSNAIGVWITFEDTKKIKYTGQYKYKGDMVKIDGIFNRACPEHGGDLDIHARSIEIINEGFEIKRGINLLYVLIGSILLVIAVCLNLIIYKKKM